jgi:hypothetical protein
MNYLFRFDKYSNPKQGFEKLKEYKFNKIRIIVEPGQKGAPEQIVGIVKRSRLTDLMKTFKNKFK